MLTRFEHDLDQLLSGSQKDHIWDVIRDVALENDPLQCPTVEIVRVTLPSGSQVYVLRDRNGILKKLQLQVFFEVQQESRTLLFLGACNHPHAQRLSYPIGLSIETRLIRYRGC